MLECLMRRKVTRDIFIDALYASWFKSHPDKHAGRICYSSRGNQRRYK